MIAPCNDHAGWLESVEYAAYKAASSAIHEAIRFGDDGSPVTRKMMLNARKELLFAIDAVAAARPIPPALSAAEANALVDAFATAARLLAQAELSDPGFDAGAARYDAARNAIIAALTGQGGAA